MTDRKLPELRPLEAIRKGYLEDYIERGTNFLIYGHTGTGKTHCLRTARRPLLVHSFDPGGVKSIRSLLKDPKSGCYADTRFEVEDAKNPTAWNQWERAITDLEREGIPETLGTYAIDSGTLWSEAMMNTIVHMKGRTNGIPQLQDYMVQMLTIRDTMKKLSGWPCDVVLTGHIDIEKDDVSGKLFTSVLMTGKLKVRIPLLFDEIYITMCQETSKGPEHTFLTCPDGQYFGRTRLGEDGMFEPYEKPDIKYLLDKAGEDASDKPF